ncbi:tat pathway signal sequence [Actinokineospora sp. HUAS TT18]|uniref:tat pathway signal sequence n=1 Tax=Actinokineospora sp. HUAS TT18 TaxID=3447451 RepID=UPI003F524EF6
MLGRRRWTGVAAGGLLLLAVVSCGTEEPPATSAAAAPTTTTAPSAVVPQTIASAPATPEVPPVTTTASPAPTKADCPYPDSGFDCDFQHRFAAVQAYVGKRPGTVGVVVRDRKTGAVWRNDHADDSTWTASTIKLAMVVDLLTRDRAGSVKLSSRDRELIDAMLHSSDDDAATALWTKYSGADHQEFNAAFPRYGLTSVKAIPGFSKVFPYWGFQKCTAADLDRLMAYVLDKLPAEDRALIVDRMRAVAANQQWGVWGAGKAARPGAKAGWSEEEGGWVMNSVGFVGPGERYTLAIMNNLRGKGGYDEGKATDTEVARLIFAGRF